MPKITSIQTSKAPAAVGPYSQGVIVTAPSSLIFVSGQLPIDLATKKLIEGDIQSMTKQVILHIRQILQEAGSDLNYVLRTDIFLKDLNDFARVNEIYQQYFTTTPLPARQTIQAAKLPLDSPIEISCIAVIP